MQTQGKRTYVRQVVGEIIEHQAGADPIPTRYLGARFSGEVYVSRTALTAFGVQVDVDEFFTADIDINADTAEDVNPTNIGVLSEVEVRDLWTR